MVSPNTPCLSISSLCLPPFGFILELAALFGYKGIPAGPGPCSGTDSGVSPNQTSETRVEWRQLPRLL